MTKFVKLFRYSDMESAYKDVTGGAEHLIPASQIVRVSELEVEHSIFNEWVPKGGCCVYCIILEIPEIEEYTTFYLSEKGYQHLCKQLLGEA